MSPPPRALITGVSGQDGSYLAELLVGAGYSVHGIDTRAPRSREIVFHEADLRDTDSIRRAIEASRPNEIYNLGAIAFVPESFESPESVRSINAEAVIALLEIVRELTPEARFFQASSCEMFGDAPPPQDERSAFRPLSPYGEAKVEAHEAVARFRTEYAMHCSCGISFNHESPRRDLKYVTRKVTDGVARIKLGLTDTISLGNLEARRDWGYAPEYVEAMWLMLKEDQPDDYVLATGISHTVEEMAEMAFEYAGLRLHEHLEDDASLHRTTDPANLVGNPSKASERLGWKAKTDLASLLGLMIDSDLERLGRHEPGRERLG